MRNALVMVSAALRLAFYLGLAVVLAPFCGEEEPPC